MSSDNDYLPDFEEGTTIETVLTDETDELKGEESDITVSINEETEETDSNFIYSDDEEEEDFVEVKPTRRKLKKEEVFKPPKVVAIKSTRQEIAEKKRQMKIEFALQKEKDRLEASVKPKKPRKPMSEEAKAKLAENRKKAHAAVRQKKIDKDNALLNGDPEPLTVAEKKKYKKVSEAILVENKGITAEQVAEITAKAIKDYDTKRQSDKAEKKKQKDIDNRQAQIRNTVLRANGAPDPNDIWGDALKQMWN
tara:strand:+ start:580 stop:1335 length:756 start_codon:yes stop_codon:yes gene_type:complete